MNKALLSLILLLSLSSSLVFADEYSWEYRDWKTEPYGNNKYRYTTNGQVAHGHEFGFLVDKRDCSQSILWLSISTHEKGLSEHKGESVKLAVKVDDKEGSIIAPLVYVFDFSPIMDIALFADVIPPDELIQDLKKGNTVSFSVIEPEQIASKFDIKTESFSLSGFSAHHLKATEACKKVMKN